MTSHDPTFTFRMCDSKNWLHDPSVILSSFAQYDVSYLGKTYARGVGDRRDAERARQGEHFLLRFIIPSKPISFLLYLAFLFLSFQINFQRVTLESAIYQQFA